MENSPITAVLLIAHGSRHAEANVVTRVLAEDLLRDGRFPIAVAAFLEFAEPDIDAGAAICVERGAGRVILLPHFLAGGVHMQRDLTSAKMRLSQRFPAVEFRLAEPIGTHSGLVDALLQRARDASSSLA